MFLRTTFPSLSLAAGAALVALGAVKAPYPAPGNGVADCPESGLAGAATVHWLLTNPDHESDRGASGLREGLKVIGVTPEGDDWYYVDAEPLTDSDLCDRVAVAVEAVRLERPPSWEWAFFRVEGRIIAAHKRPSAEARIDGGGPRSVYYVLDSEALGASREGESRAVVGRFEAKRLRSRAR